MSIIDLTTDWKFMDMQETKECRTCGLVKPVTEFSTTDKKRGYYYPHCKPCQAAKKRAERAADPEKIRAYQRDNYYANHEKRLKRARKTNMRHYRKMREEILAGLGGECAHCGTRNWDVLQIDHIHEDGYFYRKSGYSKHLREIWHEVRDNPEAAQEKYQLLCANDHHKKSYRRKV